MKRLIESTLESIFTFRQEGDYKKEVSLVTSIFNVIENYYGNQSLSVEEIQDDGPYRLIVTGESLTFEICPSESIEIVNDKQNNEFIVRNEYDSVVDIAYCYSDQYPVNRPENYDLAPGPLLGIAPHSSSDEHVMVLAYYTDWNSGDEDVGRSGSAISLIVDPQSSKEIIHQHLMKLDDDFKKKFEKRDYRSIIFYSRTRTGKRV